MPQTDQPADEYVLRIAEPGRYPGEAVFKVEEWKDGMHLVIDTRNDADDPARVALSMDGAKRLRDWLTATIDRVPSQQDGDSDAH